MTLATPEIYRSWTMKTRQCNNFLYTNYTPIKHNSNQMISYWCRSEDPSPVDSCSGCRTVAPTSTQWWQRPQLFSATMSPDNEPNSVPRRQRTHLQLPDRWQIINKIQSEMPKLLVEWSPLSSFSPSYPALLRLLVFGHGLVLVHWPKQKLHHLYPVWWLQFDSPNTKNYLLHVSLLWNVHQ